MSLGCLWKFGRLGWLWGSSYDFDFSPTDAPAQFRARVSVIRSISEAQAYRIFVFVQIRPADALLSPEPRGGQGILFTHDVVRGYTTVCVLFFGVVSVLLFRLNICSPRGAVCDVTFHSGYCRFLIFPPPPVGCGKCLVCLPLALAPVFPSIRLSSSRPPHHIDDTGRLSTMISLAAAPSSAVLLPWYIFRFAPPPATPAVSGKFLIGGLLYSSVCVSFN